MNKWLIAVEFKEAADMVEALQDLIMQIEEEYSINIDPDDIDTDDYFQFYKSEGTKKKYIVTGKNLKCIKKPGPLHRI